MLSSTRLSRILALMLALSMVLFVTGPLAAQFIAPDGEPQTNDTTCLGLAALGNEGGIQFETFIKSAAKLSPVARRATLPLHQGFDSNGNAVYYIITDSSDCADAKARGVNYVPKLGLLIDKTGNPINASVQQVKVVNGVVHFPAGGGVDFNPVRIFTPSVPDGFPPAASIPGSVGEANYSPLITFANGAGKRVVLNATQVANTINGVTRIKDFVPEVDFTHMTATFDLVMGIYDFRFVMYLRMDASADFISGFEGGVFAPNLELAPGEGLRDFPATSRQTILPFLNGIRGDERIFQRQGVQSSALGEGDPLNVMGAKPGDDSYSPLWDLTGVVWTDGAISTGQRRRLRQDDEVRNYVAAGLLTGLGAGGPGAFNADIGVQALGIVSNCPIMLRVLSGLLPYDPANPNPPSPIPQ